MKSREAVVLIFKGRARYKPIDDRARYCLFFLEEVWEVELEKISVKKKKRILSGLEPVLIPLTGQCNYHLHTETLLQSFV